MLKKQSMVSLGRQENASTASEENDSERSQKVRQPGSEQPASWGFSQMVVIFFGNPLQKMPVINSG